MRKGAAGSRVSDPKFRTGVGSTFADVAYSKRCRYNRWRFCLLLVLLYHNVVQIASRYDKIF